MRRSVVLACCLFLAGLVTFPSVCNAMQAKTMTQVAYDAGIPLTVHIEGGYLWGKSYERVYAFYENGRKLSQLEWQLENVYMLGGVVSAQPLPWLRVNVGAWSRVTEGDGEMNDYDWEDSFNSEWDMWSQSDISLKRGWILDANVQVRLFEYKGLGFWVMGGFKYSNWYWSDSVQFALYSTMGFRDELTHMEGIKGIDYEQWFYTPYAGVTLTYDYGRWHLSGYMSYSPLASAKDRDHHVLRPKVCEDNFNHIRYLGVGVQATVDLTEHFYVGAAFDFQQYSATKGTGNQRFPLLDYEITAQELAGIEHFSHMISMTIGYRF